MDVFLSILPKRKQKFIYASELYCLTATANKGANKLIQLSDLKELPNNPFKENAHLDANILKKIARTKDVICITSPQSRFIYKTKIDPKIKSKGIQGLTYLLKERFSIDLKNNRIAVLDATTGNEIKESTKEIPNHLCFVGAQKQNIQSIQNELITHQCIPQKLFLSTLSNIKGFLAYLEHIKNKAPVLFIDFSIDHSLIFMLYNNQLAATYPPVCGLKNLINLTRKSCNLPDDIITYKYITQSLADDVQGKESVMQRMYTDIKSYIDFFEVQAGAPIEALYVQGLTPSLEWIFNYLSQKLELPPLQINFDTWLKDQIQIPSDKQQVQITKPLWVGMINAILNYYK